MKTIVFWLKIAALSAFVSLFFSACMGSGANTNSAERPASANAAAPANSNSQVSAPVQAYPQSAADAFLDSCEKAGSDRAFCACVFEKVQAKYTFEEFSVIESKIIAGTPPDDFIEFTGKARAACTK